MWRAGALELPVFRPRQKPYSGPDRKWLYWLGPFRRSWTRQNDLFSAGRKLHEVIPSL